MKKSFCVMVVLLVSSTGLVLVNAQRSERLGPALSHKPSDRPVAQTSAQSSGQLAGMRFLADVPGQFRALTERPDALGLHISTTPDPSACRHYQGIARVDGADGTPFLLVTRSGNTPSIPFCPDELCCDDSDGELRNGNLIVFRMGSRDKNGERMRSNRLRKGAHVDGTVPPEEDTATIFFTVAAGGLVLGDGAGSATPRVLQHPGGMQVVGHMLAMASETPRLFPNGCIPCFLDPNAPPECDICFNYDRFPFPTHVMFLDVSNPEDPIFKSEFVPVDQDGEPLSGADGIAITPLPGGLYLMAVTPGFSPDDQIYFYRSLPLCENNICTQDCDCTLANPNLTWEYIADTEDPNNSEDAHQSLHFLREGNINGDLYIAGARGHAEIGPFFEDRDRMDLYRVECKTPADEIDPNCEPGGAVELTVRFNGRRITPRPSTGGELLASLAAATGFYESPSGELIFYATEHDNDGPSGTLRAGEWRHIDMVRENSPTLLPTAKVDGPYDVNEGSSVNLTGTADLPITKAWIQLFHETDFGGTDFSTFYPVVDFPDHDLDDFDNFFFLEFQIVPPFLFTHNDKARSIKWFAPQGCSILATDYHEGVVDEARTFVGESILYSEPDLTQVLNDGGTDDIDQELDAVDFLPNCHDYYNAAVNLQWDLDVNGSFETTGTSVNFSAATLDGPSTVVVPEQAQHPAGGPAGQAAATVNVLNVAPALTPLVVTNGAGQVVNVDVPFVLTNLPVTASADFTDPGLPDHQTASLDWGDGLVDPHTAFTTFDEAFGDGTGAAEHTHTYPLSGMYLIALSVSDDDGDVDNESTTVRVVTPEEAVEELIDLLDDLIAGASGNVKKSLLKARKALAGSEKGQSNNGALAKIRNGNDQAAIAFLNQAIQWLEQAQEDGADVAMLIAILEQVVAALLAG